MSLSAKCKTFIFCRFSGASDSFNPIPQLLFACSWSTVSSPSSNDAYRFHLSITINEWWIGKNVEGTVASCEVMSTHLHGARHCRGTSSNAGHPTYGLRCKSYEGSTKCFSFPMSVSFHQCSILTHIHQPSTLQYIKHTKQSLHKEMEQNNVKLQSG